LNVLIVEDDKNLALITSKVLEAKGFNPDLAKDGEDALGKVNQKKYKIYLVDINIPKINGLELVKEIRKKDKNSIIIMLTGRIEDFYFQKAYDYGCDDYIKKPFSVSELLIRIERHLKSVNFIEFDGYRFDFNELELYKNEKRIPLRKKEKKLLDILLKNVNKTIYNEKIIDHVWEGEKKNNYPLRQLVNELRKKFDKNYIKTVVGIGYRFEIED